jgi:hypothetical protein
MIYASPEPICFYYVKAHSGIAGNECADAIAKHSALHDGGLDVHFQPPAPDGNAYTHLYWLAAKDTDDNPSGKGATTLGLCALSDLKAKLKTDLCKSHTLGSAKTDTGYYNYWKDLRPLVNKQATNAFWNNSNPKFYKKRNIMRYRTGTTFKNTPTGAASLPMQTAPSALALIMRFTYSQAANTLNEEHDYKTP